MKKIRNNNGILKKLIFLFLTIILPLILLSSIFLIMSNHKLKVETLQSHSSKNNEYVSTLDNRFGQVYLSATSILSHSNLGKLSTIPQLLNPYERAQAINQLREYINSIKNNDTTVRNIRVYIHSMEQAYNTFGYEKGSFETITDEAYHTMTGIETTHSSRVVFYEDRLIMLLKQASKNPSSLVEVEFSLSVLKKEFDQQNQYDHSLYLFNFNHGDFILDNIEDEALSDYLLSTSFENEKNTDFVLDGARYFVFPASFNNIDASYIQIIPSSKLLQPLRLTNFYTIFFIAIMFICIFVFFNEVIKIIHRPLVQLVLAFQKAETGDLSIRIKESAKNEFSYLYKGFNDMADQLEILIDEVYQQKILLQKAEFKQLQAQINPHFLYNSFFMLQRMIKNNLQDESLQVSKGLGVYFRYITKNHADFVLLEDEYLHAKTYSNIQAMRFEGRIQAIFGKLPDAYHELKVPRLMLQPIIENAYNYGLENKYSDGLLKVSFHVANKDLRIVVEDNGDGLSDEKIVEIRNSLKKSVNLSNTAEVTGLINIQKRIQTFFKNGSNLTVSRSTIGGLKVTVFLANGHKELTDEKTLNS